METGKDQASSSSGNPFNDLIIALDSDRSGAPTTSTPLLKPATEGLITTACPTDTPKSAKAGGKSKCAKRKAPARLSTYKRKSETTGTTTKTRRTSAGLDSPQTSSNMSNSSASGSTPTNAATPGASNAVDGALFDKITSYMDGKFSGVDTKLGNLTSNVQIVSDKVGTLTQRVDQNQSDIAKIRAEILEIKSRPVSCSEDELTKIVANRMRTEPASQNAPGSSRTLAKQSNNSNPDLYWRARRSIRLWPVLPDSRGLWGPAGDFIYDFLEVPRSEVPGDLVEDVRRVAAKRTRNRASESNVVIVVFRDVETRDYVMSFASNLAKFRTGNPAKSKGIRLEFPPPLGRNI